MACRWGLTFDFEIVSWSIILNDIESVILLNYIVNFIFYYHIIWFFVSYSRFPGKTYQKHFLDAIVSLDFGYESE